jgi:pyridoxine 5-phosphate synthase
MTRLSVNLNKVALIRNSRGSNMPDLLKVAKDCEEFGAQGITVHPRPDQRHVRYEDLQPLKDIVTTEFNIEGYPTRDFIDIVCQVKPHQVTLVPDPPEALTSDTGWNTIEHQSFLTEIVSEFKKNNIRVSLFLDPDAKLIEYAKRTDTDRIEFYTGPYAHNYPKDKFSAIKAFKEASIVAKNYQLGLNAGHDLNLDNLRYFQENLTNLLEVSIGHALVCDALYFGLKSTILMYRERLRKIN